MLNITKIISDGLSYHLGIISLTNIIPCFPSILTFYLHRFSTKVHFLFDCNIIFYLTLEKVRMSR